ncbi:hypothetical protein IAD21_00917 [Abditibacteriota bacterium]|nr:hypothetical protein IAD21_00917 [Abditibacteriota bacterium]
MSESTVEWEARRVAAAFGVEEWRTSFNERRPGYCRSMDNDLRKVSWEIFDGPFIGHFSTWCEGEWVCVKFDFSERQWQIDDYSEGSFELMVRGLYCLGFEDEAILSQLPELSAHEKLELRLSLPREFWPESWKEEVRESATKKDQEILHDG